MAKRIIRRSISALHDANFVQLHPLLRRLYQARDIQSATELDQTIERLLPFESLLGLTQAVSILTNAIKENKKIVVVGDFDADGATSTAVAIRALTSFGASQVSFLVPNRFAYGYGLTPELVANAKTPKPEIILTVDNGIANHAGVSAAKKLGMQVVVTDHHLPGLTLPEADAIVNPNQHGDPFLSKHLAGVGVIFYVMLALRRHLINIDWFRESGTPLPNMSRLLDLVALGTVADLVQLDHNNRILVHQGLRRIRAGLCVPAIVALLELSDRDFSRATAADLGFAVAARLNAAGRLDDMSLGISCLLTDDSLVARHIARQLDQLNHERKGIEQDMQVQALQALDKLGMKLAGELPRGLCLYDPSYHQGVIGILAARIKDKFNRPTIVFAPGNEGELKGSARSIAGLHIRDALAAIDANHPHLIIKFGGHAMAAGLSIKEALFQDFATAFNEIVCGQISEADLQHFIYSDGELEPDHFNLEIAQMLREAGPWGQAFPEPVFDDVFQVMEQRIVGDKHLKLRLMKQDKLIDAMAFFIDTSIWPNHRCQTIQAAFRLDINEYKGRKNIQLIIEHLIAVQ